MFDGMAWWEILFLAFLAIAFYRKLDDMSVQIANIESIVMDIDADRHG